MPIGAGVAAPPFPRSRCHQRIDLPRGWHRDPQPGGPLDAWQLLSYGGGLWIPVRDAGSGSVSYSGGRYLYDTATGADLGTTLDGELVLDLNFLYVPSCAHDPLWSCPLAPDGNVLGTVVPVGELS